MAQKQRGLFQDSGVVEILKFKVARKGLRFGKRSNIKSSNTSSITSFLINIYRARTHADWERKGKREGLVASNEE